ncbi:MAG TPA: serine/threonine-protein kinase [Isosphaeraceae bacterium]|nr:serine/threonine-protein kinase [Isosphaeraceae bacterium]
MKVEPRTEVAGETLPLSLAERIDAGCDRFEAAWADGGRPSLGDFLDEPPGPGREAQFTRLLALEIELRREHGERPTRDEYFARFPGLGVQVEAAFDVDPTVWIDSHAPPPARPTEAAATGRFGDFELLGELGRGGMGVVYKAHQARPDRVVALKTIRSGKLASSAERERFRLEAEAAAHLDHPNIVTVFEVGEHADQVYFTMRLVEGESLAARARRLDDPTEAARLVAVVARAVHHAHQRGVLHRDLKPANILLDEDGQPHVTDFGLAKRLEADGGATQSGTIVGTPSYMAPEQAGGTRGRLSAAADVYSLGAILYELVTGRPPFKAGTAVETVMQVLEREPTPPGRIHPGLPKALELICLKCLEKAPERRYPTALALAEDLERLLRGEEVEAERLGLVPQLRRWARREPKLAYGLAGLVAIEVLILVNAWADPQTNLDHVAKVSAVLVVWGLVKVLYQALSRRPGWSRRVPVAWVVTEVLLFTVAVRVVDGVTTSLVVGYPLLVALAGLWSRESLVWLSVGLSELGYLALVVDAHFRDVRWEHGNHPDIFMCALVVIGVGVAHQVKRVRALTFFYERRRGR